MKKTVWMLSTAIVLAGCSRSCSSANANREKLSREWRASAHCSTPAEGALRAHLVFRVQCFSGGRIETVVPGSERTASTRDALDETCRGLAVDIQSRETAEGTVFAASLAGSGESAVLYRSRNSTVFAAASTVRASAPAALAQSPTPIRAALAAIEAGAARDVPSSPLTDAIDGEALTAHRATLLRYAAQCLLPSSFVTTLVKTSPDEVASQLFEPAYVAANCRSLQRGLEGAPRDVVGPLVERWSREHTSQPPPWPPALVRYATEHGITLPPQAR
jgi:hypothetical protein